MDIQTWQERMDKSGKRECQSLAVEMMQEEIDELRAALAHRAAVAEVADELGYLPSDDYHMPFMCLIEKYMSACDYHGSQTGERCTVAEEAIRAALTNLRGSSSTPPTPVDTHPVTGNPMKFDTYPPYGVTKQTSGLRNPKDRDFHAESPEVQAIFRKNCVHYAGNYEVTPGQAVQIARAIIAERIARQKAMAPTPAVQSLVPDPNWSADVQAAFIQLAKVIASEPKKIRYQD